MPVLTRATSNLKARIKKLLIAGPYASNFSYAKVNRNLALAISETDRDYSVRLWKEPSFGIDRLPDANTYKEHPELLDLLEDNPVDIDACIIDHFPGDMVTPYGINSVPGKLKIMYLVWEETVFPQERIAEINENATAVATMSDFTKRILKQNGLGLPTVTVRIAMDKLFFDYKPKGFKFKINKGFRFLHISTGKQRKGVDVLLKCYFEGFSGDDDVCLVIKSSPGPDNLIDEMIDRLASQHQNPPSIEHIFNADLTEEEIIDLTSSCDCAVYPSRAEGFGLPIAEAMFCGTPVITTGYSGQMDFCNSQNAILLSYELVEATDSEFALTGARWAEPSAQELQEKMQYIFENTSSEEVISMTSLAKDSVRKLNWNRAANEMVDLCEMSEGLSDLKSKHLAVVSSYNSVSGISEYSRDLYEGFQNSFQLVSFLANSDLADRVRSDADNIYRLWEQGGNDFAELITWIENEKPDILHIQHHPVEIPPQAMSEFLNKVSRLSHCPEIYVTLHILKGEGAQLEEMLSELMQVNGVFVHKDQDFQLLKQKGLKNVIMFEHPFHSFSQQDKLYIRKNLGLDSDRKIIATHGLISFHKGLLETAESVAMLKEDYPDILWLAVNALNINNISSSSTYESLLDKIKELGIEENVIFITDFIEEVQTIITLLQAADVLVLPYEEVGESASGVIRKFMTTGRPTIATDIPMFAEAKNAVLGIPDNSPASIVAGVKQIFDNPLLAQNLATQATEIAAKKNWDIAALKTFQTYATKRSR